MNRPREIVDLDSLPDWAWKTKPGAAHLYQDRLWDLLDNVGCVLCADADLEDNKAKTLRQQDDENSYVCLTHGELVPVDYTLTRTYKVKIGGVERTGEVIENDIMLFPKSMPTEERDRIITRILDETEKQEREHDPLDDGE